MRVKAYATLRDLLGGSQFDVPLAGPATVGQVLQQFVAAYPDLATKLWDETGRLTGFVTVLLNGRSIEYLRGLQTPVGEADVISLFPPVGGG
ncbi:MAG: ubiquitin-like small modifier protein 1 [Anaerolineae bacterium]